MASLLDFSNIPPIWDVVLDHLDLDDLKSLRLSHPNVFPRSTKLRFVKYLETITCDLTTESFDALTSSFSFCIAAHVKHLTVQAVFHDPRDLENTIEVALSLSTDERGHTYLESRHPDFTINDIFALEEEVKRICSLAVQQREAIRQPNLTIGRFRRLLKCLEPLDTINVIGIIRNGSAPSIDRPSVLRHLASRVDRDALDRVSGFAFHIIILALIKSQAQVNRLNLFAQGSAGAWSYTSSPWIQNRPQCSIPSASLGQTVDLIRKEYSTRSNILNLRALSMQVGTISTPLWSNLVDCVHHRMQSFEFVRIIGTAHGPYAHTCTYPPELFDLPFASGQTSDPQTLMPHWALENFAMTFEGVLELIQVSSVRLVELRNMLWVFDSLTAGPETLSRILEDCRLKIRVYYPAGYREVLLSSWLGGWYPLLDNEDEPEPTEDDHRPQVFIVIEDNQFWRTEKCWKCCNDLYLSQEPSSSIVRVR